MLKIFINELELRAIERIRIGLSEETVEARVTAVKAVKHDVIAMRLGLLEKQIDPDWSTKECNFELARWVAATSAERNEAAYEYSEVVRRYEQKNEKSLNVAEHAGKLIWHTIQDEKFEGVQTDSGILKQVSDEGRQAKIRGAIDKDVIRKNWRTYRGVVHLGMAIDYCENNPSHEGNVLSLAERVRRQLSQNCPRGTTRPYVDPEDQISFIYISTTSGPRFRNRGLPFGIS
ncbi:hypothetical protein [Litoreibacter albidus]|uniref:hypothetical protein n=1 Tax=Litoreibacter albidus TaxID=670155 RepID=UPI0037367156